MQVLFRQILKKEQNQELQKKLAAPDNAGTVIPGMEKGIEKTAVAAVVSPKTDLYRFLGKNQKKVSIIAQV